jgi:hypothetical protein
MARILVRTRSEDDWRSLLADPQKQWRAGYSAMAAARAWQAAQGWPPEIAALFPAETELIWAIPEHKVPLPGGRRESQCDVFALLRDPHGLSALAVEAKVSEPFGPTLEEWLADGSPGKRARLDAICEMLGCAEPLPHLRYQLFHRTAAAVVEARRLHARQAAMVVQSFAQDHRWFDDFAAFAAHLGHTPGRGALAHGALPHGGTLSLGWATGDARWLA